MIRRRSLTAVAVLLVPVLTACDAPTGPPDLPLENDGSLPIVTSEAGILSLQSHILRHGPVPLATYEVTFWARAGEFASARIDYLPTSSGDDDDDDDDDGENSRARFLDFVIPPFALDRRPNGEQIALGDSLLVSVTVDPNRVLVNLQPTGLTFRWWNRPRLRIWYAATDPDLNGDGTVDSADAAIEGQLAVWYQEEAGDPWHGWTASRHSGEKRFDTYLDHFSNYTVSW